MGYVPANPWRECRAVETFRATRVCERMVASFAEVGLPRSSSIYIES